MTGSPGAAVLLLVLASTVPAEAAAPPAAADRALTGLDAGQMLDIAAKAEGSGALAEAQAIYRAVARDDPDSRVRNEARYRLARLLTAQGNNAEAATQLRAILDAEPGAQRVRLELARVLALMGEEGRALAELRRAQAGDLPPDVRQIVRQVALAYRSRRPVGLSLEVAVAPDSNINRATRSGTLDDTVLGSLDLSDDARAQSGLGLRLGGQGFVRQPLGKAVDALVRLTGQSSLYRQGQFNDVALATRAGLEWKAGRLLVTPTGGRGWRWFGGRLYTVTDSGGLNLRRSLGPKAAGELDATAGFASYRINPLQSGPVYALSLGYDRALTQRAAFGVTLSAERQEARDPAYATTSGGIGVVVSRDIGRMTLYGQANVRRLEADARLGLFRERRRETWWRIGAGAALRQFEVAGFAPLVRLSWERNASSVSLYDYRRLALEAGVTRAF